MNGTDTGSSASLFPSKPPQLRSCSLSLFQASKAFPVLQAVRLGCGLGFPVNQLNLPRVSVLFSPVWGSQTLSVFKRPGSLLFTEVQMFMSVVGQTKKIPETVYMHNQSTISLQKSWPAQTPQQQFLCLAFLNNFCLSLKKV